MKATLALARRFWRPYLPVLMVGLVIMAVTAGLNGLAIQRLQPVFRNIFQTLDAIGDAEQQAARLRQLWDACLLLFAAFAAAAVGGGISSYVAAWSGQHVLRDVRQALFERLESMSMRFYERESAGVLISRVSNDTQMLERTFSADLANLVVGPLSGVVFLGLMVRLSWRLSLLMVLAVPVVLGVTRLLSAGVKRHARRGQEKMAQVAERLHEMIAGIRVVKVFGLERIMADRFREDNQGTVRERLRTARLRAASRPLSGVLASVGVVAAILLGAHEIVAGRIEPDGLLTFMFLAVQAGNYVSKFTQQLLTLQQAEGSALRVVELLEQETEPPDPPDAAELEEVEGLLEFDHVHFGYEAERPVLEDFCLRVAAGERVAIVGPSGAGKTTVANLAARLYDPDGGAVRVDGIDLRGVTRTSYRRFVALVPQDTVLFAASVRDNIRFGRPDATDEEIVAAAKAAGAHDFIQELPDGYDTRLSSLGQNLSGGQRQRIAIARALLRRPRILILDEATSALDRQTEAAVQEGIKRLMAGRTALIIAHRLSTIRDADRIVVMLGGRIVEQGTHEELLARRGVYYQLYHVQAEAFAAQEVEGHATEGDE